MLKDGHGSTIGFFKLEIRGKKGGAGILLPERGSVSSWTDIRKETIQVYAQDFWHCPWKRLQRFLSR